MSNSIYTENALTTRTVHLTETEILASHDFQGLATAFRYAAHTRMAESLKGRLHNQEVCDRFEDWHDRVHVGPDGAIHFSMEDGAGDVWLFFGTAPSSGQFQKFNPGV